jgi:hypothetical protein
MEKEVSTLFYSDSYYSYSPHLGTGSSYSLWMMWTTLILSLLGLYTMVSLLSNVSACYNFIVAWNLISRSHRVDLERIHHGIANNNNNCISRRIQIDDALTTRPYNSDQQQHQHQHATTNATIIIDDDNNNNNNSCPICLTDFEPSDMVSSSGQLSCRHLFHNKCLSAWLQRDGTCPCCRSDILPASAAATTSSFLVQQQYT